MSDANERKRNSGVWSAERWIIHCFCNCNHRSEKQHVFLLSFVLSFVHDWNPCWCWAECPTDWWYSVYSILHIYHLPLRDARSKKHWDKQHVDLCSKILMGFWKTVVWFTAWCCCDKMNSLNPCIVLESCHHLWCLRIKFDPLFNSAQNTKKKPNGYHTFLFFTS